MPGADGNGYVVWAGCCLFELMLCRRAVSPAGRRWQMGLVRGLQGTGTRVEALIHVPEPLWPRGRMREPSEEPFEPGISGVRVAYWNLPLIRPLSMRAGFVAGFDRLLDRHGPPAALLTYNAYPHNVAVGRHARDRGIPWVNIVADVPESERGRRRHDRAVREADGRVLLSWAELQRPDLPEPKLHLDGGVREIRGRDAPRPERPPVVLYTGSLGHWGGVDFLVDGFRRLERDDAELWICGHGENPRVERAAREDNRIRFLGLVSEEKLREVSERAWVFVNPRPSDIPMNAANFPSKVLEYLSYCKPIVSTWTGGLAPRYREILTVLDEETPEGMAAALDAVLDWSPDRRDEHAERVRRFVEEEKLWESQARRLTRWLDAEIDSPPPR